MKLRVLYVSYNGILEPIGRSQVFRYLVAQSQRHQFVLLSFERRHEFADRDRVSRLNARITAGGGRWIAVPYRGFRPRFVAAAMNMILGWWRVLQLAREHDVQVLHARSYLGAILVLPANILLGIPYLFDMRGFWPDEGVGVGRWKEGSLTHRVLKLLERTLLRRAGAMVTLTESGARHLSQNFPDAAGRPVRVIPTCADLERFRPGAAQSSEFVLGYVGSANEAYLFREFLQTYAALARRRPEARLLILNRRDHPYILDELSRAKIPDDKYDIKAVDHDDVAAEMHRMTVGTVFVFPYAAKIGSTPTKLAEFLATGIPCLANEGCGDVSAILEQSSVGISIKSFTPDEIEVMIDRLLMLLADPRLPERCRRVATEQFSLASACDRYHELYVGLVA